MRDASVVFVTDERYTPSPNEEDKMRYTAEVCAALNIEVIEWII